MPNEKCPANKSYDHYNESAIDIKKKMFEGKLYTKQIRYLFVTLVLY